MSNETHRHDRQENRMLTPSATQDLIMVGGGHSHALALRMLAMKPVPGLRLTLVPGQPERLFRHAAGAGRRPLPSGRDAH